jgi:hypothetical protein
VPEWQRSFLVRRGAFPIDAWRRDLQDPHVRWVALDFDPAIPAKKTNDARVEVSAYRVALRDVLEASFVRDATTGGFVVFRRRAALATGRSAT